MKQQMVVWFIEFFHIKKWSHFNDHISLLPNEIAFTHYLLFCN
ncbi:protein of unknown function [Bacillus velezensis]|nr:protein of unknown function [Bacillus velezensis]